MLVLLPTLLPMLLVDILNPVLFAVLVFAAGSSRPVANSTAILVGHTFAYFVAGIAVSFGIEQVALRLANPHPVDFVVSGLIGLGLFVMAVATRKSGAPVADDPAWELTPAKCVGFGAVINFIGVPFALPYFAVVDQILKADLAWAGSLATLAIYNLCYALPFVAVPAAVAVSGESARPMLERINSFLTRASDFLMPWMFGVLGMALIADSVAYFYRGEGLWQF